MVQFFMQVSMLSFHSDRQVKLRPRKSDYYIPRGRTDKQHMIVDLLATWCWWCLRSCWMQSQFVNNQCSLESFPVIDFKCLTKHFQETRPKKKRKRKIVALHQCLVITTLQSPVSISTNWFHWFLSNYFCNGSHLLSPPD